MQSRVLCMTESGKIFFLCYMLRTMTFVISLVHHWTEVVEKLKNTWLCNSGIWLNYPIHWAIVLNNTSKNHVMVVCLILRLLSFWRGLRRPELREACTQISSASGTLACNRKSTYIQCSGSVWCGPGCESGFDLSSWCRSGFLLIRIRIRLFTLMRIRIRLITLMRIRIPIFIWRISGCGSGFFFMRMRIQVYQNDAVPNPDHNTANIYLEVEL